MGRRRLHAGVRVPHGVRSSTAASAGLLVNLVFFGLIFALSLFLQRQRGLSPLATGLAFLPVTVLIVVSNLVAGRILPARGTAPSHGRGRCSWEPAAWPCSAC